MSTEVSVPGAAAGREESTAGPSLRTGLEITGALAAIGGVCGVGVGIALTYLGNVISGYPIRPSVGIYAWNASIMGGIAATLGPPMVWSILREVPLWRALVEPAVVAVGASVLSMLFAPSLFPVAVPLATTGAALRLRWAYKRRRRTALGSGEDPVALVESHAERTDGG